MVETTADSGEHGQVLKEHGQLAEIQEYEQRILEVERPAFRFAYLILRDAEYATALLTRTLVSAFPNLSQRGDMPFLPWLLGRMLADPVVRRASALSTVSEPPMPSAINRPPPEVATVLGAQNRAILGALSAIPFDDRLALYLRYFLNLAEQDIATVLSCDETQAGANVKAALVWLEQRLNRRQSVDNG